MSNDKTPQESLAYFDDLTGLYNRRYLKEKQKKIKVFQKKNMLRRLW